MVDVLQISDSCSTLTEGFVTKNRHNQILLSYVLGSEQREMLTTKQARESIGMDCSCHDHARKPQPENEFHKLVPGLLPSSLILRTVAAVVVTFWWITFSLVHEVIKKTTDSQGNSI